MARKKECSENRLGRRGAAKRVGGAGTRWQFETGPGSNPRLGSTAGSSRVQKKTPGFRELIGFAIGPSEEQRKSRGREETDEDMKGAV